MLSIATLAKMAYAVHCLLTNRKPEWESLENQSDWRRAVERALGKDYSANSDMDSICRVLVEAYLVATDRADPGKRA
jgi:hypothetical protein